MIKATFDSGVLGIYLRAELIMSPLRIALNDGDSMGRSEAEELLQDLEKITNDLYLEMQHLWNYSSYRPERGDPPDKEP